MNMFIYSFINSYIWIVILILPLLSCKYRSLKPLFGSSKLWLFYFRNARTIQTSQTQAEERFSLTLQLKVYFSSLSPLSLLLVWTCVYWISFLHFTLSPSLSCLYLKTNWRVHINTTQSSAKFHKVERKCHVRRRWRAAGGGSHMPEGAYAGW